MNTFKIKISLIAILCCWASVSVAQRANALYSARTGFITSWENAITGACWETGTESYSGYLCANDNLGAGEGCVFNQCDANGNCTYNNAAQALFTNRNNGAWVINNRIDAWEDDSAPRNSFNGDDDCRRSETVGINFRTSVSPSNGVWTQTPTYGGTNNHTWANQYTWRYTAGGNSISPSCSLQSTGYGSGDIYSWSMALTAGVSYRFYTCGSAGDTYLRIYNTDGFTVLDSGDDNCGSQSQVDFMPSATGTYFLEVSNFSRSPVASAGTLFYQILPSSLGTVNKTNFDFCDASGDFAAAGAVNLSGFTGTAVWRWGSSNGGVNAWCSSNGLQSTTPLSGSPSTQETSSANACGTCCFPKKVSTSDGNADRIFVYVQNGGCAATATTTILVNNRYNEAPSSLTYSPANPCIGQTVTLTANFPNATNILGRVEFFSGSCGGTLLASVQAPNNSTTVSTTITAPSSNTTYWARYNPNSGAAGCAATSCVQVTVVPDAVAPTISCPSNISTTTTGSSAVVNYVTPVGSDNCAGQTTVLQSGLASGSAFPIGTTTNVYRVTDAKGNTATCSFTVTVTDNGAPTITCPASFSVNTAAGTCAATATYSTPTASDAGGGAVTVTQIGGQASGTSYNLGATVNTFRATDGAGNSSTCSFTVTVVDNIAPSITCPGNQTLNTALNTCAASTTFTNPSFSDNCAGPTLAQTGGIASGGSFPRGVTTNTFRVTDGSGNSTTCTFTITVNDAQAPSITCPSSFSINTVANTCAASPTYTAPTGTDNCTTPSPAVTTQIGGSPSGTSLAKGSYVNTFRVVDGTGNSTTCSFTITVVDAQNPTITCPSAVTANTTGICGATGVALGTATVSDNCTGVGTPTNNAPGTFPVGATIVTWQVSDAVGRTSTCTQSVTIIDNQAPSISCPSNITVSAASGTCAATVNYSAPSASDNCSVTTTQIAGRPSGASNPSGTTLNIFRATDASGNSTTCSFTVTVVDTQAPTITCPSSINANTTPGACSATVNFTAPVGTDNCSGSITEQTGGIGTVNILSNGGFENGLSGWSTDYSLYSDCMDAVACYQFSGNANDNSGFAKHGTVVGATLTTDRFGNSNSAYYFGDSVTASQYIQLPTYSSIMGSSEEFSISLWCKYGGVDRGPNPISLFPDNPSDRLAVAVPYHPYLNPADIYWDYGNITTGRLTTTVSNDLNWHHYVCIKSAASNVMEIYRDNVKIATKPGFVNLSNKNRNFRIGGATDVGWFIGAIDDIRIFDRRLSQADVTKLFNNTFGTYSISSSAQNTYYGFCANPDVSSSGSQYLIVDGSTTATPRILYRTIPVQPNTNYTFEFWAMPLTSHANVATFDIKFNGAVLINDLVLDSTTCLWKKYSYNWNSGANTSLNLEIIDVEANGQGNDFALDEIALKVTNNVYPLGTTVNTFQVTDAVGLTATCSFSVTVIDNEAPTITCPSNITTNTATGTCAAIVNYAAVTYSDNCTGASLAQTGGQASGTSFPKGTTINAFTVTDGSGNTASCSFTVTVNDNEAPSITCPANITVANTTGACSGVATWTTPTLSGGGGTVITYMTYNEEFFNGQYPTTQGLNWCDYRSNLVPSNTYVGLTIKGSNDMVGVTCSDPFIATQIAAALNTATPGSWSCDGHTWAVGTDDCSGNGSPCGGTPVSLFIDDEAQGTCGCTSGPGFYVRPEINLDFAWGGVNSDVCFGPDQSIIVEFAVETAGGGGGGGASDNCPGATIAQISGLPSGSNYPVGTTTNVLRITDASGNSTTCSFTVNVNDEEDPTISCPSDIVTATDAGVCSAVETYSVAFDDNCPGEGLAQTAGLPSGSAFPHGTTTNTFIVTDAAGNTAECSFTVTVNDEEDPTITCPANIVTATDPGQCSAVETYSISTSDNCPGEGWAQTAGLASGSAFPKGTTTNTFLATDASGNTAECSFTVTVNDEEDPTITCPSNIVTGTDPGQCSAVETFAATGDDNCPGESIAQTGGLPSGSAFPKGTTTNTFTITDASGNTAACSFTVTVNDTENPAISCPANITVNASAGVCHAAVTYATPAGTDNCPGQGTAQSAGLASGSNFPVGTTTNTFVVTDAVGLTASCSFTVTVIDDQAPIITSCPPDRIVTTAPGTCSRFVDVANLTATDNCGVATIVNSYNGTSNGDGTYPKGTHELEWTVTDVNGNTSVCYTYIQVNDNEAPNALCKNITVNLNNSGFVSITPSQVDNGSTDNCAIISRQLDNNIFTCSNVGANTVTLTIIDNSANFAACTATVTVVDAVNPIALCENATLFLDGTGNATLTPSDIDDGSSDACGIASRTLSQTAFSCANLGSSNPVTLTVTDANGNTAQCSANVTVIDNTPPTAVCSDFTVNLDANGNGTATGADFTAGSTDNCTIVSRQLNISSFDCSDVDQSNPVTVVLTDQSGNNSFCFVNAIVEDNIAPNAVCANLTLQLDAAGNASTTPAAIGSGSTDACGIQSMSLSQTAFTCAHVGDNTVTLTVIDVNSNASSCTATVTVQDVTPPVAVCQNVTVQLDAAGNGSTTPAAVNNGSSDACGIGSLSLNNSSFTCANVGSGNSVTLTVTDVNGNSSTCTATVTVEDNVAPIAVCQNVTVQLDATGNGSTTAAAVDNGSSDACGIASLSLSQTAFVCSEVGNNTETLTVTDVNGNSSTCTTTVTVQDNVPPVAVCQNVTVQLDATGNGSTTAAAVNNGSSDACGIASLSLSQTAFVCSEVGNNTETLTVTDVNGNSSTCTTTVTVQDNVPPVANCTNVTVNLDASGNGSTSAAAINNGSSDACGIASLSLSQTAFTCAHVGPNTVTLTVTDVNGNSSTCTGTVTVVDAIPPVALCQNVTVQLDATGNGSTTAAAVNNGSSDACGIASLSLSQTAFTCSNVTPATPTNLFISEYVEGTSNNKFIEIFNGTASPVNLSGYQLSIYTNGSSSATSAGTISGTIAPGGTAVFKNTSAVGPGTSISNLIFNGNDAVALRTSGGAFVDIIGRIGDDPGSAWTSGSHSTLDRTLRRKSSVNAGITTSPTGTGPGAFTTLSTEWDVFATDVTSGLGAHAISTGNPVTLTVTDVNGNSSTCNATVRVEDNVPPVATCQNVTVDLNASGNGSTTAAAVNNGSSDACGIASLTLSQTAFTCAHVGNNTVTLTVKDVNNNTSTCTATVVVRDLVPPTAICRTVTVDLDASGNGSTTAAAVNNGSSDACGIQSLALSQTAFTCANVGNNTVTLTVTDVNGNQNTCNGTVVVRDLVAPVALCQNVTVQLDATGNGSTTAAAVNNGSSDACGIASLSLSQTAFTCASINNSTAPTNLIISEYIEGSGNNKYIEIYNGTGSSINLSGYQLRLYANGSASATTTTTLAGTIAAGGTAVFKNTSAPVIAGAVTNNSVNYNGNDAIALTTTGGVFVDIFGRIGNDPDPGNSAGTGWTSGGKQTQDRTLRRKSTVTAGVTTNPTGTGPGAFTTLGTEWDQFAIDVTSGLGAHSILTGGNNPVVLTVTDVNGNVSTCNATVTVQDNVAPVATCQNVTVDLNSAGNGSTTAAAVNNGSSDACGIANISLSQTAFNCGHVGNNTVTLTVTDVNNNSSTCTATVTVRDLVPPVALCQNVTVDLDASGNGGTTAAAVNNGSSDACGIQSLALSQTAFTCANVGNNSVTLTVTDVNGNVSTCNATVTVRDLVPPVALCQNVTVQLDATGNGSTTAAAVDNGSNDACGIASLSLSQTSFNCSEVGDNPETLTVTDVNGNVSTCATVVTVEDNVDPVAICQDVTVQLDADGAGSSTAAAVNNGSNDACGIASLSLSQTSFDCDHVGPVAVTLTVTDVNGNSSTCDATVTVEDHVAPEAMCQNVDVYLDADGFGSTTPLAVNNGSTDACGIAPQCPPSGPNVSCLSGLQLSQKNFDCSHVGPNTVILYVTDVNGNTASCTATVMVHDDILPTAICQNLTIQLDATGNGSTTAEAVNNGSYDNCGVATLALNQTAFVCEEVGENTVTLTVTDVNGNQSTCDATITVEDNVDPIAVCQDVTVQLDATGNGSTTAAAVNNGSSDACGIASLMLSQTNFACAEVGNNPETLTVTDVNGNVSTCATTVVVEDNVDPIAICQDVTVQLDASGNGSTTAAAVNNGSSDACGIASLSLSQTAFVCSEVGNNTETLTVTDVNGNVSTCTTTVTVEDNVNPVAICQDVTVQLDADGHGSTTATAVDNGSNDACGIASLSLSQTDFSCSEVGNNPETLTVTDVNGNVSTCATTVVVEDNVDPVAICQNVTVQLDANGNGNTTAAAVDNGSNDACGIASLSLSQTSFVCSEVGNNTETLTVTDVNGNSSTCTTTVTVEDNVDPVAICQTVTVQLDASGNGSTTAAAVDNGSNDACGIASLSLSQTSFVCSEVGNNTETLTVTDVNGNVSTCTATVVVEDNVDPVAICQNVTVQLDATGNGSTSAAAVDNGSNDACGIASLSLSQTSFNCSEVGDNPETLTVTDVNGNVSTCATVVTVEDNVDPIAICQNVTVQLDASGNGSTTAAAVNNGSSDACGIASLSLTQTAFVCSEVGDNPETLTVTDVNGNSSTCATVVTVEDNVAPIATCQNVTVQLDATGNGSTTAAAVDNGSNDACGIANLSLSQTAFNCSEVGNNPETLTVTDVNGNVSTCATVVTVEDNVAPVAVCQNVTVQLDAAGSGSTTAAAVNNGSSDACGIASLTLSQTTFNCSEVGDNAETLTVTDVNGNSSTCGTIVTVIDDVDPVAVCRNVTVTLANGTYTVTGSQVNNGSSDACGIASLTVSPNTFTCANIGNNNVVLTVTDVNGNSSTCGAVVTVIGSIPSVTITQSQLPVFCQGQQIILTANPTAHATGNAPSGASTAVTYNWTTGGTTQAINVYASGNYGVTITNIYGCTASNNTTVVYSPTTQLSSYTLLATKHVKLDDRSVVNQGGVGIQPVNGSGKVELKKYSFVTAPGTFVKAPTITVDATSAATNKTYAPAGVTLPTFYAYPNNSLANNAPSVTIKKNTTVTLTGMYYKDVKIEEGATAIFTQSTVIIKKLDIKKNNGRIRFSGCTNLILKEGLKMEEYTQFNPDQHPVTIYSSKEVHVDKGSTVYANIYADKHIHAHGGKNAAESINLYGQFIADHIHSHGYINWNYGTNCGTCAPTGATPVTPPTADDHDDDGDCGDDGDALTGNTNTTTTSQSVTAEPTKAPAASGLRIGSYPNPFSEFADITFTSEVDTDVRLSVLSPSGNEVEMLYNGPVNAQQEYKFRFNANSNQSSGIFFYRIATKEGEVQVGKMILAK